jgi:hypothetical protein
MRSANRKMGAARMTIITARRASTRRISEDAVTA